jgi:hypothetical protein
MPASGDSQGARLREAGHTAERAGTQAKSTGLKVENDHDRHNLSVA